MFTGEDTLGSLNLYSRTPGAFDEQSRASGAVLAAHAAHAAVALSTAGERDRAQERASIAVALQRSMLTDLPDLGPVQASARYLPAVAVTTSTPRWAWASCAPCCGP